MGWWARLSNGGKVVVGAGGIIATVFLARFYRNYKAAKNGASSAAAPAADNAPVAALPSGAGAGIGGGTLQPPTVGGNVFGGNTWTDPATGDTWYEISGAIAGGGTPGSLVGVWVDGTTGAIQYGSPPFNQSAPSSGTTTAVAPTTPPATAPPAQGSSTTAPSFPGLGSIGAAMAANGEQLADFVWNPQFGDFLVLTNKGGVYNIAPGGGASSSGGFYGSYLSLPPQDTQGGPRSFSKISVNGDGGYTITDTNGESYTFGPNANFA